MLRFAHQGLHESYSCLSNSFDVASLIEKLVEKPYLETLVFNTKHGFLDPRSEERRVGKEC